METNKMKQSVRGNKMRHIVFDIETTGLNPWHGDRITCICAKDSEGEWFKETDRNQEENDMIRSFLVWVSRRNKHILITKNGLGFDIPFILSRLVLSGACYLKDYDAMDLLVKKIHLDLHTITKKWVSLNDMATLFKCQNKSGSGKNAIKLHENEEYEELIDYCCQDVLVTEQVYLRYERLKQI
jgi:uncharacterized protein YprB with RNaseH-like and TPR domain